MLANLSDRLARLSSRRSFRVTFRIGAVGLIYWVAASAVLDSFMDHWALGDKWRKSRFNRTIHYTAPPPFVYRVLTPWLVNEISQRAPEPARAWLASRTPDLRQRYQLRGENDVEYAVAYYLIFVAYLGTLLVWRANLVLMGRGSPLLWDLAPPIALLLLPMTFMQGGFIYDAPELILTSLALCFFMRRNWLLFYPTFFLVVLNKDANILLPVWFLAPFLIDRNWKSLLRHAALSVAVGAPPFLATHWWFRDRHDNPLVPLWETNLRYLTTAKSYWSGFDVYAPHIPAPEGFHPLNFFLLVGVLVFAWRRPYLRQIRLVFLLTVLVYLPFFLLFGYMDEIRVFGPSFAALMLLGTHALREAAASGDAGDSLPEPQKEEAPR
jgi:hypothetical protein